MNRKTSAEVWEWQEDESQEAFDAFEAYREYGDDRSLAKVAQVLGKNVSLMERWSVRHNWKSRVRAYQIHEARILNDQLCAGKAAMRERAIKLASLIQNRAAARLARMTETDIGKLTGPQAVSMLRQGIQLEDWAREIPESEREQDLPEAPTFVIRFLPEKPDDMVAVRMSDGLTGYLPRDRVPEFQAEYPDAVVII